MICLEYLLDCRIHEIQFQLIHNSPHIETVHHIAFVVIVIGFHKLVYILAHLFQMFRYDTFAHYFAISLFHPLQYLLRSEGLYSLCLARASVILALFEQRLRYESAWVVIFMGHQLDNMRTSHLMYKSSGVNSEMEFLLGACLSQ